METESWQDLETEHDDIYGDLESSIFTSSRSAKNPADAVQIESLLKDNGELKQELQKLKKENLILLKNISSLHLTAKKEIEKKNFLINQLQQKLKDTIKPRIHKMSKKEADEVLQKCQEAYAESHSKVTLEEIKRALEDRRGKRNEPECRTKSFKFGNMSYYFINHQNPCHRSEEIEFPVGRNDGNAIENGAGAANKFPPSSPLPKDETSPVNDTNSESCVKSKYFSKTESGKIGQSSSGHRLPESRELSNSSKNSANTYKESTPKFKNGLEEKHPNVRKSPRHLKIKSTSSRSSSRDEPSRHSKKYSSERSFSRPENIYKKNYDRKRSRDRERSSRGDSRSDSPHSYSSDRASRNTTRSGKRHHREIS